MGIVQTIRKSLTSEILRLGWIAIAASSLLPQYDPPGGISYYRKSLRNYGGSVIPKVLSFTVIRVAACKTAA